MWIKRDEIMILKIYNDVELLIDEEDVERVLKILSKNAMWHLNSKTNQVQGWCNLFPNGQYPKKVKKLLSRVIMCCNDPTMDVDHIHHNLLDFRKSELRVCSHRENCFNQKLLKSSNTSGYKGVYKRRNGWCARIRTKYGRIHLGDFKAAEDAASAYDRAAIKYHGVYAQLNFAKIIWNGEIKLP